MTTETVTELPRSASGHAYYGHDLWEYGEDGGEGVVVQGHGLRALAAINAYGRDLEGPAWRRWAGRGRKLDVTQYWAVVFTTCGCTPEQYIAHEGSVAGCECAHPGLPPCDPDRFSWTVERVKEGASGAVALTEVLW